MILDRRAYYNLLLMGLYDRNEIVPEAWQLEDYRTLTLEKIFERLSELGIELDRPSFLKRSEEFDTPEDLTDNLTEDDGVYDKAYLLLFELWRRLVPEKQCLSIFCDEFDRQIYLYDQDLIEDFEPLEDAIANLQVILDENTDQGADPHEIFNYLKSGCASDLECFLYDFIALQIDEDNITYATELLDNISPYVEDVKWFTFLKIRLLGITDPPAAKLLIRQMVSKTPTHTDLDFNLEILSFLVQGGEREVFAHLLKQTIPLIKAEEDFKDLLTITADYFLCLDQDNIDQGIQEIIGERESIPAEEPVFQDDPHLFQLAKLVSENG